MCRSVSFDPKHYESSKSEEMRDVVNNPLKAIEIFDYQEDEVSDGIKMNTDSSLGQIMDLPSPFKVEHTQIRLSNL